MKQGALAWDYAEITISESEGKWYYGLSHGGGGSGCSVVGEGFDNREDVIEDAYENLHRILSRNPSHGAISKHVAYHLQELISWQNARKQYSLF
jgi:hypothetical protein